MGSRLTPARLDRFLAGTHLARLAVVDTLGAPYVVPAWYEWDGSSLWFVGRERSQWCIYLDHDPRAAAVIDVEGNCAVGEERYFTPRVTIVGVTVVVERPGEGRRWVEHARAMALRYRGEAGVAYLESTLDEPRWLVELTPAHLTSWEGGGWAPRYRAGGAAEDEESSPGAGGAQHATAESDEGRARG